MTPQAYNQLMARMNQRMANWPATVIIGPFDETHNLMAYLEENVLPDGANMPTIDVDALMESIVESVRNPREAPVELQNLPMTFLQDGLLGESLNNYVRGTEDIEGIDLFIPEMVTSCASKLGYRLLDEFKQLKMYDNDDELRYSYKGMTSDQSILLWRRV